MYFDFLLIIYFLSWVLPILKKKQMIFLRAFRFMIILFFLLMLSSKESYNKGYLLDSFSPLLFFHSYIVSLLIFILTGILEHIYSLKTFALIRISLKLLEKLNRPEKGSTQKTNENEQKSLKGFRDILIYTKKFASEINMESKATYLAVSAALLFTAYISTELAQATADKSSKFFLLKQRLPSFAFLIFLTQFPAIVLFRRINKKLQALLQR